MEGDGIMRNTMPAPWARAHATDDNVTVTVSVSVPLRPCPPSPVATCPPPPGVVWHIGAPRKVLRNTRRPGTPGCYGPAPQQGVDLIMDLKADQKVTATLKGRDEMENVTDLPEGATVVYEVDNTAVIALTDAGDGSAEVAATGVLGVALVTATATFADESTATGVLAVQVVPGDAATFAIVTSEPTEVTPDEPVDPEIPADPEV